jgi:hypothetical protein
MVDERPRLTASEIEAQLLAELQKLPSLRDTQSVRICAARGTLSVGDCVVGALKCVRPTSAVFSLPRGTIRGLDPSIGNKYSIKSAR